jgi:acyl-CoA dehydrogenase
MMNAARFSVGLEGVGLSERAYQRARDYARDRVQGSELGGKSRDKVAILRHPDVRRMLLLMKSRTEALRAVAVVVAAATDQARRHPDPEQRWQHQAFVDLMIPVVKGWSTESAVEIASLGVQVHGGMGFIEETGAAQHLRDARITPIYEGTTGIQAADLIGRKIARDGGQAAGAVIEQMREVEHELLRKDNPQLAAIAAALGNAVDALERAVKFIVSAQDPRESAVGSVPFLELFGIVAGGWQMGRAALASHRLLGEGEREAGFHRAKLLTTRFYADHVLARAPGLAHTVVVGAGSALAMADDAF